MVAAGPRVLSALGPARGRIGCVVRAAALLAGPAFALPITCATTGDGTYSGGIQPSPAGRINPADPAFVNGGGQAR